MTKCIFFIGRKIVFFIRIENLFGILSDVNECAMNMSRCDDNANCTNTDGSYNCSCNHGYEGDGFNCTGNYLIFDLFKKSH